VHLVTLHAHALPVDPVRLEHKPTTLLIDCRNAEPRDVTVDLHVDRTHFPGQMSLQLPEMSLVIAEDEVETPIHRITDVRIPADGVVSLAVTLQAPPDAQLGDRYRLDIIERDPEHIIGGASYEIAITMPASVAGHR
jgi:hypothetical protein